MRLVTDPNNIFDLQSALYAVERLIEFYTARYNRDPEGCSAWERERMNALCAEYAQILAHIAKFKERQHD